MRRSLTLALFGLSALGMSFRLFSDDGAKQSVQATKTEHVPFALNGLIRLDHSYGDLNVEGWDRPEVEITVTKWTGYDYRPERRDLAARRLESIGISAERRSDTELVISTGIGKATRGVWVEYEVRAPRNSRLVIHHGNGQVLVTGIAGDVEATSSRGDIVLMIPDPGSYAIDARSKMGTVSSDFSGSLHVKHLIGEQFVHSTAAPPHRLFLRTGFGGITLKEQ